MSALTISAGSWLASGAHQPVLLGIWFGLLHAFDADHVSTIGGLAAGDRATSPMTYAVRWAFGHAAALGLIAVFALGFGLVRVTAISGAAELLVALTLIVIGFHALRAAAADIGSDGGGRGVPHLHRRAGVLMGMLHGGAGSAAVLALIPLAVFDSGVSSAGYLLGFSLGVAAGACGFSGVLGGCFARAELARRGVRVGLRGLCGGAAVATAALLLWELSRGG
jgi:hypothetical protein